MGTADPFPQDVRRHASHSKNLGPRSSRCPESSRARTSRSAVLPSYVRIPSRRCAQIQVDPSTLTDTRLCGDHCITDDWMSFKHKRHQSDWSPRRHLPDFTILPARSKALEVSFGITRCICAAKLTGDSLTYPACRIGTQS